MSIGTRSYARPYGSRGGLPRGIQGLLIANAAMFLLGFFTRGALDSVLGILALSPERFIRSLYLWQPGTYLFVHASIWEFVWNMLALWMFGRELEDLWGTQRFLRFFFISGSGAALLLVLAEYAFGNPQSITIGTTAAVYGILAASAALWPDRDVIFIFFPMKMKYFVALIAGIDFLISYNAGIGQIALLTGLAFGFFYVKSRRVRGFNPMAALESNYKAWKLKRAKRKFQVYLKKHGSSSPKDPWVN